MCVGKKKRKGGGESLMLDLDKYEEYVLLLSLPFFQIFLYTFGHDKQENVSTGG